MNQGTQGVQSSGLTFYFKSLSISLTADSVNLDNYIADAPSQGYLVSSTIPLSIVNKTFVYLVPPNVSFVNLQQNLSDVKFAVLPIKYQDTSSPPQTLVDWSTFLPSPSTFLMNLTGPFTNTLQKTEFISSSATSNNTLADDVLQYIAISMLYSSTNVAIAMGTGTTPGTGIIPTTSTNITTIVPGIINSGTFKSDFNKSLLSAFTSKIQDVSSFILSSTQVTDQGEVYPSAPISGQPYSPAVLVAKAIFNNPNASSRLTSISTPFSVDTELSSSIPTGWKVYSLPIQSGDVLHFNCTVSPATGTVTPDPTPASIIARTYNIQLTVV